MTNKIPTPHIEAKTKDAFAKTVLMPGDPNRAKFIVDNFLTDAVLVNNVRGVNGYTGYYNGKKVSVMASGMGMPSMAIYSKELFDNYGVSKIIRIGTCGAIVGGIDVGDVIVSDGSITDSNITQGLGDELVNSINSDPVLVKKATKIATGFNKKVAVGKLFTSDGFYTTNPHEPLVKQGVLAVEMESFILLYNAKKYNKRALAICTVSDSFVTGNITDAKTREQNFMDMVKIALELA